MNIEILMATYNGEKYIKKQIDSILNQTVDSIKLIIQDDNSTDQTLSILKQYEMIYPNKIKVKINSVTKGHCYNFLSLIEKSKADYIFFFYQDDIWEKNKVEVTLKEMFKYEEMDKNNPIVIHTDQIIIDEKEKIIADSSTEYFKKIIKFINFDEISFRGGVHGCTMLLNKKMIKLLKKIKIWECKNLLYHDWSIAMIAYKKGKIYYLDKKTMKYRIHQNNISLKKERNFFCKLKKVKSNNNDVFNQYYSILGLLNENKKINFRKLSYLQKFAINYSKGNWRFEKNFFKKIIKLVMV